MSLDDSIYLDAVWSSESGMVVTSSSETDSTESDANEAEAVQYIEQNSEGHQDDEITEGVGDGNLFLKRMMTTIAFITDETNIEYRWDMDFWPTYRNQVILDVCVTFKIPKATLEEWYVLFFFIFVIIILLLIFWFVLGYTMLISYRKWTSFHFTTCARTVV